MVEGGEPATIVWRRLCGHSRAKGLASTRNHTGDENIGDMQVWIHRTAETDADHSYRLEHRQCRFCGPAGARYPRSVRYQTKLVSRQLGGPRPIDREV